MRKRKIEILIVQWIGRLFWTFSQNSATAHDYGLLPERFPNITTRLYVKLQRDHILDGVSCRLRYEIMAVNVYAVSIAFRTIVTENTVSYMYPRFPSLRLTLLAEPLLLC